MGKVIVAAPSGPVILTSNAFAAAGQGTEVCAEMGKMSLPVGGVKVSVPRRGGAAAALAASLPTNAAPVATVTAKAADTNRVKNFIFNTMFLAFYLRKGAAHLLTRPPARTSATTVSTIGSEQVIGHPGVISSRIVIWCAVYGFGSPPRPQPQLRALSGPRPATVRLGWSRRCVRR